MIVSDGLTQQSRKGPEAWFTGVVWIDPIASPPAPARVRIVRVSFAPGARTAWHTHPVGQTLQVLSGVGWIQKKGSSIQTIHAGDTVWIEPGEVHWHGATANQTMVHLAVQESDENGTDVVWGESVRDEEYLGSA